jgi:endoglycosylceramidase
VIGFDIINEPHWGSYPAVDFERDRLQAFEARVIEEVRAAAPGWLAFAEPSASRNLGFPTSLEPFEARDVVYAPHTYDAVAEQGGGFDPAQRDGFIGNIALLREEATRLGAALWIGEYGGLGSDPQVGAYMDAAYDGAAAVAASSMYWDYGRGGGYAPIDADGNEVTAITDVIVRPYPERIAGDPIDWDFDETDGSLTVRWTPDPSIAAPTMIAVPPRFAPVTVDCRDCTVTLTGYHVEIEGGDGEATIR